MKRGRPQTEAGKVFRTLIAVLRFKHAVRNPPSSARYCSSATLSRTVWEWAETGKLTPLWQDYLRGLSPKQLSQWRRLFVYYRRSWSDRRLAARWAPRVHSRWFRRMNEVLKSYRPSARARSP